MAELTRQELEDLATSTNIPDNTTELIDPSEVRDQYTNERDSTINKLDDGIEVLDIGGRKALKYSNPQTIEESDSDALVTKSMAESLDEQIKESRGWWNIADNTDNSLNPQLITSNTRTKITISPDSVIDGYGANGLPSSSIWDGVSNKITPIQLGDSYIFRISFTANPTLNNRNLTIDLDLGGSQGIIFERSTRLARGANVDTKVSMTNSIFALSTFVSNGGEIYITCDGDVEIFNKSIFIQKVTQND